MALLILNEREHGDEGIPTSQLEGAFVENSATAVYLLSGGMSKLPSLPSSLCYSFFDSLYNMTDYLHSPVLEHAIKSVLPYGSQLASREELEV